MTENVISLTERRSAPNDDVVTRLEYLLGRARAGEIVNMGVAYVERDGSACSVIAAGPFANSLQAGISQMFWKMGRSMHEASVPVDEST